MPIATRTAIRGAAADMYIHAFYRRITQNQQNIKLGGRKNSDDIQRQKGAYKMSDGVLIALIICVSCVIIVAISKKK